MTAMPDRSEGEPPEGGAVDDGWAELLGDGDSAPASPAAEPSAAGGVLRDESTAAARADDAGKAESSAAAAEKTKGGIVAGSKTEPSGGESEKEAVEPVSKRPLFAPPGDGERKKKHEVTNEPEAEAPEKEPDEGEAKEPDEGEAKERAEAKEPARETFSEKEVREPRPSAPGSASSERGSSWGFVGALVVAAALVGAWVFSTRDGGSPTDSPTNRTSRASGERDRVDRSLRADHAHDTENPVAAKGAQEAQLPSKEAPNEPPSGPDAPPIDPDAGRKPPPVEAIPEPSEAVGDPRAVPPGTPAEIAKVFESLPASQFDRPPVGKIGTSGIHIDRISMGTEYESSRCGGRPDGFSISKRQRANVCFRVVHDRNQVEQLRVLWQKDGGTVRRTTLSVPEVHAYRTRAFLVLRKEYAGRWTVRIMSMDGIELAAHAFSVVE